MTNLKTLKDLFDNLPTGTAGQVFDTSTRQFRDKTDEEIAYANKKLAEESSFRSWE